MRGVVDSLRTLLRRLGFDIVRHRPAAPPAYPADFDTPTRGLLDRVGPFTMTSPERLYEVRAAAAHVTRHGIPGAFVECGTWRGGCMMAAALTLLELGAGDRELWLYDTFEGMTEPDALDVSHEGEAARELWQRSARAGGGSGWCSASEEDVRANLASTGYDVSRVRLVRGRVEETIPGQAPDSIAVLRLDTDWHASTRHELVHLFPRLARGGILIVDDYGHWQGARKAVDEYVEEHRVRLFLARTDYTGRVGVRE